MRGAEGTYPNVTFDFLGYCFRPRAVWGSRSGRLFCGFTPAVSPSALKAMREKIRDLSIRRQTQLSLDEIADRLNPLLRGWIRVLRTVHAFGAASSATLRQSDAARLGDAEVQALFGAQGSCESISAEAGSGQSESVSYTGDSA